MKRLFSETPGPRRANVLCEYRTSPRRRHASSKERLAVLMLYVHTLHDLESLQKAFREGQLKSFLDQSLEFLAPNFGDGTRCADGRQQMRSFDEARFGSNASC